MGASVVHLPSMASEYPGEEEDAIEEETFEAEVNASRNSDKAWSRVLHSILSLSKVL